MQLTYNNYIIIVTDIFKTKIIPEDSYSTYCDSFFYFFWNMNRFSPENCICLSPFEILSLLLNRGLVKCQHPHIQKADVSERSTKSDIHEVQRTQASMIYFLELCIVLDSAASSASWKTAIFFSSQPNIVSLSLLLSHFQPFWREFPIC